MSKIIAGLLVACAGSLIAIFGFSDSCSSEIMAKIVPFLGMLPGIAYAWFHRVKNTDVQPVGALGITKK